MGSVNLQVNLYSCVIENQKGEIMVFKKAVSNCREKRVRPMSYFKSNESAFIIKSIDLEKKKQTTKELAAFGTKWGK